MGAPYLSLLDVLEKASVKPDILKLGIVHPLPKELIADFLRRHDEIKVLEELDDFLEQQVKALAYDLGLSTKIIGKKDTDDWMNEYTPDKVDSVLRKTWPDLLPPLKIDNGQKPELAPRPPQLCPGCGHRSAFYAVKLALAQEDITVAEIGCHTLGYLEPYNMGQVMLCMGHGAGTAAGLSLFNTTRRVVAFLGDSTFYHAALPGIINAVFNQHNFTLIIMENGTTAMTGHQNHPGVGYNFNGPSPKIPLRQVLEGLGVTSIREVDAYAQSKLLEATREATAEAGFSVVIAKHPCMLKMMRERKATGAPLPPKVDITDECDQSHTCISSFGCPTFQRDADGRIRIQEDLCIGDGSCKQTCPAKAIVHKARPSSKEGQ